MSRVMKNARGKSVQVAPVTRDLLRKAADRIASRVSGIDGVTGAIIAGSVAHATPDDFSDLDMDFFAADPKRATRDIESALDQMGAERDDDASSIHFPLDYPARLLDGLYVEFNVKTIGHIEKEIDEVLHGKCVDDGLIYSLRVGHICFDHSGRIRALQDYCCDLQYPRVYLTWITAIGLDCEMKLLRQAVAREDWHQATTWLANLCLSSVRILFAKNARFFPGHKRLLSQKVPELEWKPRGFVEFWQQTLSGRIHDWQSVVETAQRYAIELKEPANKEFQAALDSAPER